MLKIVVVGLQQHFSVLKIVVVGLQQYFSVLKIAVVGLQQYAAFTYSESQKEVVRRYIINQKSHHSTYSFREEYEAMLREWGLNPKQNALLED